MEQIEYQIAVEKNLPLGETETVNEFTSLIRVQAQKYLRSQLNLSSEKESGLYVTEIRSNIVIFEVYKYHGSESSNPRFYALKFARDKTGNFEFSSLTEVERVTTWRAKNMASVTKNLFSGVL